MPRTSRAVAQRLAAQKTRKRRPRSTDDGISPAAEQVLDRAAPAEVETPQLSLRRGRARLTEPTGRAAVQRRRYADYGTEYRYVWNDLRRIALVAGSLLLLLVVLSFFIR